MKRFLTRSSSKSSEESKTNKGEQKGAKQPAQSKKEQKPAPKEGKPKGPQKGQKGQQKTVRNAQSAIRPGNNSGIGKQKESPLVQFGPILKEFLASKEMVGKGISVQYDQAKDQLDVTVSFKKVLENGVSTSDLIQLEIGEYLAQRKSLLKVKDDSSQYKDFVSKLLDRLGVDITHAKPSVAFKSVESFILKHLSPVERAILFLNEEDYDRIDTRKVPEILAPTNVIIKNHYGSNQDRNIKLVKVINTDGPVQDIVPPNWALNGVTGISKGVLLETLRIKHAPQLTEEQRQNIEAMADSLFGLNHPGSSDATSKSEDYKDDGLI